MAPSFLMALASIIAVFFPQIPMGDINLTLNTLVILISGAVIMIRQVMTGRSTMFGGRPQGFVQ